MDRAYLGLNILHNTAAAIVVNGELLAACEEERFNREKNTQAFPDQAIEFCLKQAGIPPEAVSGVAVSFDYAEFLDNANPFEQDTIAHEDATRRGRDRIRARNAETYQRAVGLLASRAFKTVHYIRHHLAHAAAAFFSSGFDESNIIVVDGRGERESTTLWHGRDKEIRCLRSYPVAQSLGHVYTYITHACGLYANGGGEGKTMGLSAYGSDRTVFGPVVKVSARSYAVSRKELRRLATYRRAAPALDEAIEKSVHSDLAFGAQQSLEEAMLALTRRLHAATGVRQLVLSGGVALNCCANARLTTHEHVEKMYVQPAANDPGTAIGAAMLLASQDSGPRPRMGSSHVYLGPEESANEIERVLRQSAFNVERIRDPARSAAERIADGQIVGWFQGRMEFGPRALGNRSILADPRRREMRLRLNLEVKKREHWRPFAPTVLAAHLHDWFVDAVESPFMSLSLRVQPVKQEQVPAITHVDGTARIQSLSRNENPLFHDLISHFHGLTGIPMVLNTSFNSRGEPIVRTASEALSCFDRCGLDCVYLADWCATRRV